MNGGKQARLVLLVPGFQDVPVAGSQLALLKNQIAFAHPDLHTSKIASGSYAGYRVETPTTAIDMFEIDWQSSTPLLSAKGWIAKLWSGTALLSRWIRPATFVPARRHHGWYYWFGLTFVVMLIWWVTTIGTLFGQLLSAPCQFKAWHIYSWHVCAANTSDVFGYFKASWVFLSFLIVSLGVSVSASIDVADLFRRYLSDAKDDNGLPTRSPIRGALADAIRILANDRYHDVLLVGHSFGVLVALDAIANGVGRRVRFISLGGFLGFLAAEDDWVKRRIGECLGNADLEKWGDYYSDEDAFAAPTPIAGNVPKFKTQPVVLNASFSQRITGEAHAMYFRNAAVQDAILAPA